MKYSEESYQIKNSERNILECSYRKALLAFDTYQASSFEKNPKANKLSALLGLFSRNKNYSSFIEQVVSWEMDKNITSVIHKPTLDSNQSFLYWTKHGVFNFAKTIYLILIEYIISRVFLDTKTQPGKHEIICVDNFIIESMLEKGSFSDRYFPELDIFLSDESDPELFYLPVLTDFKYPTQFYKAYQLVNRSPQNFLMHEQYLNFFDYLYALFLSVILPLRFKPIKYFSGFDVTSLVRSELLSDIGSYRLCRAICRYLFICKLAKKNIKIKTYLQWTENQDIDKAHALAVNHHHPDTNFIGYQGYFSSQYEYHKLPLKSDQDLGLLPKTIFMLSFFQLKDRKFFFDTYDFQIGPAFRYANHLKIAQGDVAVQATKGNYILVALPIQQAECITLLSFIKSFLQHSDQAFDVRVRLHPGMSSSLITELKKDQLLDFQLDELAIIDSILEARVVITSASSICVDTIILKTPLIILGNTRGITMNPLPENMPREHYKIIYHQRDFEEALTAFADEGFQASDDLSSSLMLPNKDNVSVLLSI